MNASDSQSPSAPTPISVTTETTRTTTSTLEVSARAVGSSVRVAIRPPETDPFPLSGASILLSPAQANAFVAQLVAAVDQAV